MWPFTPLTLSPVLSTQLLVLFTAGLIFVLAVLGAVVAHFIHNRREIRSVECPENHQWALVVMGQSADGAGHDTVAHCSLWPTGRAACGLRCLDQLA